MTEQKSEDGVEEHDDEPPAKKGRGVSLLLIAATLVSGIAAGAAAYIFTPAPAASTDNDSSSKNAAEQSTDAHAVKKKKTKKTKKNKSDHGGETKSGADAVDGGEIRIYGDRGYFILDPLIISIEPIGASRHLKISLVLETGADHAEALQHHTYRIKDVLNTYLRSVDSTVFEDPAAMSRLRAQILRRIHTVAPDANVDNILITEFILT